MWSPFGSQIDMKYYIILYMRAVCTYVLERVEVCVCMYVEVVQCVVRFLQSTV